MVRKKRLTFEQYRDILKEKGYTLLITKEEYSGSSKVYKGLCPCGHECNINYNDLNRGGSCCRLCGNERRKKTCLEKFGFESSLQNPEIIRKSKETLMKNYGVENPSQNAEILARKKATMLERHGVEHALQNSEIYEKRTETMLERHGVEHSFQNPEIREKFRQTMLENHGVEHALQSEESRAKYQATCMENHGVENPTQHPDIAAKQKETLMKNYGVEHPAQNAEIFSRQKETMVKNHGVQFPLQNKQIFEKQKQTMLERHGAKFALQVPELFAKQQKAAFSYKEYKFPSGKVTPYQGYENFCLDDLVEEGYTEDDIINSVEEVPIISYTMGDTDHKYFPDIFIPKENKLIEVKCKYTFERYLEQNMAKAKACIEQGYKFELRIYDDKGIYTLLDI